MTLIITALSDDAIIQVSDRRLTIDGKLYDDSANKAICVTCADARFTVAYTGQVEINGQRTDEWLVDHLGSIDAGAMNFLTIYESMKQHAISTFSILHSLGRAHGITFVFAGFGLPGPFAAVLSNIEDTEGHWLKDMTTISTQGSIFVTNGACRSLT